MDTSLLLPGIVATTVAVSGSGLYMYKTDSAVSSTAEQIRRVASALDRYRADTLKRNAVPTTPPLAALISGGYLPAGFSLKTALGPDIAFAITDRNPAGDPRGPSYSAQVWLSSPPTDLRGQPDPDKALSLVSQLGFNAGTSQPSSAGTITGFQGRWLAPNPAGTAAYTVTYDTGVTTPAQSDLNLAGKNITSVGSLDANKVSAGEVNASGNATVGGNLTAGSATINGPFTANSIYARGDVTSDGWLRTRNNTGWINDTHGGGMYMSDPDWVRSVNNKNIYTGGQVLGGSLRSDGRLSTREFLQVEGTASAGADCGPNGLVGRTVDGSPLYCINGKWSQGKSGGRKWTSVVGVPDGYPDFIKCRTPQWRSGYRQNTSLPNNVDVIFTVEFFDNSTNNVVYGSPLTLNLQCETGSNGICASSSGVGKYGLIIINGVIFNTYGSAFGSDLRFSILENRTGGQMSLNSCNRKTLSELMTAGLAFD